MPADASPGAWLRIPDAATRLRVNLRTVHDWSKQGKLTKRPIGRGRVEVWVPDSLVPEAGLDLPPVPPQDPSDDLLRQHMALLDKLSELQAPLLAELTQAHAHLAELERENGRLQEVERGLRADLVRAREPWWRRLFQP